MTDEMRAETTRMMDKAIEYAAQKSLLRSREKVLEARARGDCEVCGYLRYSLARQAADYLGARAGAVKTIYLYSEAEPMVAWDQQPADRPNLLPGLHLIVWAANKNPALLNLADELSAALNAESRRHECVKANQLCHQFDIAVVNDEEVEQRDGFGGLIHELDTPLTEVWHR